MAYCSFEEFDEKIRYSEAFQREAMRIAFTSGLPRKRVAIDLGIGLLTLLQWVSMCRLGNLPANPDIDLAWENERLRLENRMMREESDVTKRTIQSFASNEP